MEESKNTNTALTKTQSDFYHRLRYRIRKWLAENPGEHKWADYLLLAPDVFHLLCRLLLDEDVPDREKAKLLAAIVYYMSPIDIIPELLFGPVGYIDDVAIACYVLNSVLTKTDPDVVRKHWAGEEDVLELIERVLAKADSILGSGLWARIRKHLK